MTVTQTDGLQRFERHPNLRADLPTETELAELLVIVSKEYPILQSCAPDDFLKALLYVSFVQKRFIQASRNLHWGMQLELAKSWLAARG